MERNGDMEELVKRAKARDQDAFSELVQMYTKDMYKVAIAILMNDEDAADAIQDTLLIGWEKLDSLKDDSLFKTWMTRILINACYSIRKKRQKEVATDIVPEEQVAEQSVEEANFEFKEMLQVLDERYRLPILLFYGQGYPIADIAKLLRVPKSTIQTRLSRGRKKLETYYREMQEDR